MSHHRDTSSGDLRAWWDAVSTGLSYFCENIAFLFQRRLSHTRMLAERGGMSNRHPHAQENLHDIHWRRIDELCAYTHTAETQLIKVRNLVVEIQHAGASSKKHADAMSAQLAQLNTTLSELTRELAESRKLASARHEEIERKLRRLDAINPIEERVRALEGLRDRLKTLEQRAATLEAAQGGMPARMREIAAKEATETFNRLDDPAAISERALANAERFSSLVGESIKP